MEKKNKMIFIFTAILFALLLASCENQTTSEEPEEKPAEDAGKQAEEQTKYPEDVEDNPIVTITMENDEQIIAELYPDIAPNTVTNFVSLIEDGYYNELIFHRVIPEFMIQGGDPEGNGTGGPGYSIPGEFSSNNFENELVHKRGVLSMARSNHPDSAGSQFFIMVENSPHLDGEYAAFGKVTEGLEVVDKIVSQERDAADKPLEDQKIKTVEVDTKGYDYPEPKKIEN